jgi:hypothetical protein
VRLGAVVMSGPDSRMAINFLGHWTPGGPWMLSAIEPDGPIQTRTFHDLEAAQAWIEGWQGKRNLYFSVNAAKSELTKKATKADIAALNALHVDLDAPDGTDLERAKANFLARLKAYRLPPSVILDSGGGLQGFWLIHKPIAVNGPDSIGHFEACNRRLETEFGGDHCHNIDRIMRLPGTVNLPNAVKRAKGREKSLATVVEADWECRYEIDQFEPMLPPGKTTNETANGPVSDAAEELACILKSLPSRLVNGLREAHVSDRSGRIFSVVAQLAERNFDDPTIERIIHSCVSGGRRLEIRQSS